VPLPASIASVDMMNGGVLKSEFHWRYIMLTLSICFTGHILHSKLQGGYGSLVTKMELEHHTSTY
jgi:hypothetical protein